MQTDVRTMEKKERIVKAVWTKVQGRWTTWQAARQKKLSWRDILGMVQHRLQSMMYSLIRQISVYVEKQKTQAAIYVRHCNSGAHTSIVSESLARRPIHMAA